MKECFLCGANGFSDSLECHHIFGGALRDKSEKYGLVVYLCGNKCHRNGRYAAHKSKETALILHRYGQQKYMKEQNATKEDFMREFYKNYL